MQTLTKPALAPHEHKPLGLVWIKCTSPLLSIGLEGVLKFEAHLHCGSLPPVGDPSAVIYCPDEEDAVSEVRILREAVPEAAIVVFDAATDPRTARELLRAGACGFIHAEMPLEHIVRIISVAREGETVLSRELLERLLVEERRPSLYDLSYRQVEILELLSEGLSNAQIAKRLFLSESTIKQHLRAAYKILEVKNRTEARKIFLNNRPQEMEANGGWMRSV